MGQDKSAGHSNHTSSKPGIHPALLYRVDTPHQHAPQHRYTHHCHHTNGNYCIDTRELHGVEDTGNTAVMEMDSTEFRVCQ